MVRPMLAPKPATEALTAPAPASNPVSAFNPSFALISWPFPNLPVESIKSALAVALALTPASPAPRPPPTPALKKSTLPSFSSIVMPFTLALASA